MAFDKKGWKVFSTGHPVIAPRYWSYNSSEDSLATIVANGYFDTQVQYITQADLLWLVGNDSAGLYQVTSGTATTPVSVSLVAPVP